MDETRSRFLFSARQRMLDHLLAGWRRRGSSLLHIGLNGELSPETFWEAGFDVTALDRSPERLSLFREKTGPKVEYSCGNPELLPFGDGEFDYAVLVHHGLKKRKRAGIGAGFAADMPAELSEALRVASRGVIIIEWNRFSLAWPPFQEKGAEEEGGVLPWELCSLVRRACPERRRHLVSVLPLWRGTWPSENTGPIALLCKALIPLNITPVALPFGAVLGMRVDWKSLPLTPADVLRTAAEKLCPVQPREGVLGCKATRSTMTAPVEKRKES